MTVPGSGFTGHWSTHQLTEYFAAVSGPEDEPEVLQVALDRTAETFDAEFAAVTIDGAIAATVGFGLSSRDRMTDVEFLDLPPGGCERQHDAFGVVQWLVARMDGPGAVTGSVPGAIIVGRVGAAGFVSEEEQMLRAMATVLGLVLRNLRSLVVERARQDLLRGLLVVQRLISSRRPLQQVLDSVTAVAAELLGAGATALVLRGGDGRDPLDIVSRHVCASWQVMSDCVILDAARIAMDAGRVTVALDEAPAPVRFEGGLSVPVQLSDGLAGVLLAWRSEVSKEAMLQSDLLHMFAEQVSVALTDAATLARMNAALHDHLTGLATRTLFLDRLGHAVTVAQARAEPLSLMYVDLDRFKQVNDSLGHAAGDEVLRQVGDRLRRELRSSDTAGRLGGDEFVVLLEGLRLTEAAKVAARIHDAITAPMRVGGRVVTVGASIGVTDDRAGTLSSEGLLDAADGAMYRAKGSCSDSIVLADNHEPGSEMLLEQTGSQHE